jgi:hypothetical protein
MFKLIGKIGCISLIVLIVFFYLAINRGGMDFRWLGNKTEEIGKYLKLKSNTVADKADTIHTKSADTKKIVETTVDQVKSKSKTVSETTSKLNETVSKD